MRGGMVFAQTSKLERHSMAKDQKSSPLFILVAMLTALAALYFAREILLPVALAILFSFLLTPLANRLERWRIPRMLSVILVVTMSFSLLGLLGWIVTNQLVELNHQQQANKQNLLAKTQHVSDSVGKLLSQASHFGKLHQQPAKPAEASDQKPGAAADATTPKKSQAKPDAPRHISSAITDAAKLKEAGKALESPAEREAVPVRIVDMATSPF